MGGDAALLVLGKRKRSAVEPLALCPLSSRAPNESASPSSCLDTEEECDLDYVFFLKSGAEGAPDDEGSRGRFAEAMSGGADESDPQYMLFLEHLKEDGKSYTLVGEGSRGETVLHKYEPEENVGSEGLNLGAKRLKPSGTGVPIEKQLVASANKNFRRHLRSDTSKVLQDPCTSKDTSGRKGNDKAVMIPKDTSRRKGNDKAVIIPKDTSRRKGNDKAVIIPKDTSGRKGNDKAVILPKDTSRRKGNDKAVIIPKYTPGRKGNDKAVRILKESSCRRQECKRNEVVALGNHAREDCKGKPPQPWQTKSSEKQQEESEQWDDSYMVFLHHVRKDGEVVLFNHDRRTVRYDEDEVEESSSSDSDVEILAPEDIVENEGTNPFVTTRMACIDLDAADPGESDHSEFRVKLLEILKSPYNVEEYKELLHKVKYRRRKEIIREMRGGREVSYPTKRSCPSYLDQYTDLADKISSAQGNRPLTLNILRGFFFYLSNIPTEGVFRPWMDQASMSILPPVAPGLQSSMSIMPPVAPGLVEQLPLVKAERSSKFPPTPQLGKQIPCLKAEPSEIFPPTPPQFSKPLQRLKVERP